MLIGSLGLGAFLYRNYIIDAVLGLRSIPQKLVTHLICKGSLRTQLPFISVTMAKCIQFSNLELIADMLIGPPLFLHVKQQKWGHPISRSLMVFAAWNWDFLDDGVFRTLTHDHWYHSCRGG